MFVLMFISGSQPTTTEKLDIDVEDVEKLLPTLLSVVDLQGLLGLENDDNKNIFDDKEEQSVEKSQNEGVNKLREQLTINSLYPLFRNSYIKTVTIGD